jgi:hypothetical protein
MHPREVAVMLGRFIVAVVGAVIALVAVGCAATPDGTPEGSAATPGASATPTPSPSASTPDPPGGATSPPLTVRPELPTMKPPTGIPKTPSDPFPADLLVGIVTKGGSGPCYEMETNDGILYALYGGDGVTLSRGDTIRVKIKPLLVKIYCGPGRHVAIVNLEVV